MATGSPNRGNGGWPRNIAHANEGFLNRCYGLPIAHLELPMALNIGHTNEPGFLKRYQYLPIAHLQLPMNAKSSRLAPAVAAHTHTHTHTHAHTHTHTHIHTRTHTHACTGRQAVVTNACACPVHIYAHMYSRVTSCHPTNPWVTLNTMPCSHLYVSPVQWRNVCASDSRWVSGYQGRYGCLWGPR